VLKSVHESLSWWEAILQNLAASRSLPPRCKVDPSVWVDASTSWGIGVIFGGRWAAWRLILGWKACGRDIGWAESVALELAVLWMVGQHFLDCDITVRGDNTGVIGAFKKGRSRNALWNATIRRMASCLVPFNISVVPVYVASSENRADSVSRGILGPQQLRLGCAFELPPELNSFLLHVTHLQTYVLMHI